MHYNLNHLQNKETSEYKKQVTKQISQWVLSE